MNDKKFYSLPPLPYEYNALEPIMTEEQLSVHYEKHHKKYVDNANLILEKFDKAKEENTELDYPALLKKLSFNIGGHILHSLFWQNLAFPKGDNEISQDLRLALNEEYGSFDRFKEAFSKTAVKVEGSGWAALSFCKKTKRPLLMQIEKHNVNLYPAFNFLLLLDVWEHAYYIDYKSNREKYVESFWEVVNWSEVNKRYLELNEE